MDETTTFDWARINIPKIMRETYIMTGNEDAFSFFSLPQEIQFDIYEYIQNKAEEDKHKIKNFNPEILQESVEWWAKNFKFYGKKKNKEPRRPVVLLDDYKGPLEYTEEEISFLKITEKSCLERIKWNTFEKEDKKSFIIDDRKYNKFYDSDKFFLIKDMSYLGKLGYNFKSMQDMVDEYNQELEEAQEKEYTDEEIKELNITEESCLKRMFPSYDEEHLKRSLKCKIFNLNHTNISELYELEPYILIDYKNAYVNSNYQVFCDYNFLIKQGYKDIENCTAKELEEKGYYHINSKI